MNKYRNASLKIISFFPPRERQEFACFESFEYLFQRQLKHRFLRAGRLGADVQSKRLFRCINDEKVGMKRVSVQRECCVVHFAPSGTKTEASVETQNDKRAVSGLI